MRLADYCVGKKMSKAGREDPLNASSNLKSYHEHEHYYQHHTLQIQFPEPARVGFA